MALQKQNVSINFSEGIDTKTNDKLATKLLSLENGVFNKGGEIKKRLGYSLISKSISNTEADISVGRGLGKFDEELLMFDDDTVYSYSSSNDEWVSKGDLIALKTSLSTLVRNSAQQTQAVSAYNSGITVTTWEDSRGGVRYSVSDYNSSVIYISDIEVSASGDSPKAITLGNYIYIFYMDSADLKHKRIAVANPEVLSSAVTLKTDAHADHLYGIKKLGNAGVLAYKSTSDEINYFYVTNEGIEGTALAGYPTETTIAENPTSAINLTTFSTDTTDYLVLAWHSSALGLKSSIVDRNFNEIVASTQLDSASGTVSSLTGCQGATGDVTTTASGTVRWFYTMEDSGNPENTYIKSATIDLTGAFEAGSVFKRSVGLVSEAFVHNSKPYINVLHQSTLQSTIFTLTQKGDVISKISPGVSGNQQTRPILGEVYSVSDNKVSFASSIKGKYQVEDNTAFSLLGVAKVELDFSAENAYRSHLLGENLHIVGSILFNYDGVSNTEHGFLLFPENISLAESSATGSIEPGTYSYQICYEWLDNRGLLHRSAPSIAESIEISATPKAVDITIPTLRLTSKSDPRSEVVLSVYRTEDGGSIYYKVTSATVPTYNDTSVDSVTFTDTLADTSIISNEILYTTGGVLDHVSPPTCSCATVHKNRMFISGLENKNTIWYSKEYSQGEGVGFNDALILKVDPKGGDVTALASLDDKLIIFKRDNIYGLLGDGPTATGDNSDYSIPDLITTDVGCTNLNSVALIPLGLIFKSVKGIYLLNRELQTQYIGAPVEAFNSEVITSTRLVDDANEVRFTTSSGNTLVYNYYFNQWSTFTNQASVDAIIWDNTFYYLNSDGQVFKETADYYYDGDKSYKLRIETPWIKMTGIQNYQRIYRASILGDFKSSHKLKMKIFYDYKSYSNDLYYFDPSTSMGIAQSDTYGTSDTYGSNSPYGGDYDDVYQFRVHLGTQKCQSIKFEIEDIQDSDSPTTGGESFAISNLSLEVGVKKGLARLRSLKSL